MQTVVERLLRLAFSSLRKQAQEVEKVIEVLQPGPLGIKEHKYTNVELAKAKASAARARENWTRAGNK